MGFNLLSWYNNFLCRFCKNYHWRSLDTSKSSWNNEQWLWNNVRCTLWVKSAQSRPALMHCTHLTWPLWPDNAAKYPLGIWIVQMRLTTYSSNLHRVNVLLTYSSCRKFTMRCTPNNADFDRPIDLYTFQFGPSNRKFLPEKVSLFTRSWKFIFLMFFFRWNSFHIQAVYFIPAKL